ncbi:hypothetical protein ATCC90586_010656 [Pythium insidiosum]|nr:hypothetical protein ATCC90586_010656 [Pythium insidiosum]
MGFSADPLLRHGNTQERVVATVDRLDLHDVNADADGTFAIDLMAITVLVHGFTSAWALQQVKWSRFYEI